MNRRELLSGLVATLAAGGVAVSAEAIEAESVAGVDLDKIDELLETWQSIAKFTRAYGVAETSEFGRAICDGKFMAYRSCINDLRTALGLSGLGDSLSAQQIVSVENGNRGTVYDAHGNEVKKCIEADLETGLCVVWVIGKQGKRLCKTVEYRAAPLTFEPR